jgi:hypothetical protein
MGRQCRGSDRFVAICHGHEFEFDVELSGVGSVENRERGLCSARGSYQALRVSSLAPAIAWLTMLGSVAGTLAACPCNAVAEERTGIQRSERARAAEAYDRGIRAFDRGELATAARHFLEADALAPSKDALSNAVAAAAQARDRALLKEALERATKRRAAEPELAERALAAWAEFERTSAGNDTPTPVAAETSIVTAPPPPPVEQAEPTIGTSGSGEGETRVPVLLYASAATTAVLAGLTTWSGLDALAARRRLPGSQAETDAVMARAHRTDALLAGTALLAGLTVVLGVRELQREANEGRPAPWVGVTAGGAIVGVKGSL